MDVGNYQISGLAEAVPSGDRTLPGDSDGATLITRLADFGPGAWRSLEEDPAALTLDTSLDPASFWRSEPDDARVLVFTSDPFSVELEMIGSRVVGQIVPPGPGEILVEKADGATVRAIADDVGFFDLAERPRGRVRLRCETPTGRLVTDWLCL
jgi:hypothetical protein